MRYVCACLCSCWTPNGFWAARYHRWCVIPAHIYSYLIQYFLSFLNSISCVADQNYFHLSVDALASVRVLAGWMAGTEWKKLHYVRFCISSESFTCFAASGISQAGVVDCDCRNEFFAYVRLRKNTRCHVCSIKIFRTEWWTLFTTFKWSVICCLGGEDVNWNEFYWLSKVEHNIACTRSPYQWACT